MERVLAVYRRPYDPARPVVCMDETPRQLISTHSPGALYAAYPPAQAKALWDRFEFVYTPKHGSWLNVAVIELNVMIGQCLKRRTDSIAALRDEVTAWQAQRDRLQAQVNWQLPPTMHGSS